jgi:hypothetical protein
MASTASDSGRDSLAAFVQISDLHIGKIDPASGDADISWAAAQLYSNTPWLDGLLGHHGRALRELAEFVEGLKISDPGLRLIVSGDLSRFGGRRELALARSYIEDKIDTAPPRKRMVGLRLGEQSLVIPGNHDQWGGTAGPGGVLGPNYSAVFSRPLPFIEEVALGNRTRIVFLCVDSDANVTRLSPNRVLAIGAFQTQLDDLNKLLHTKRADEFRIVLIHHSWEQSGKILRMADASKAALAQFMYNNEVSAMLCGHSHKALLQDFMATTPGGDSKVYELRAGSTTQHDQVPLKWISLMRNRPLRNWNANSLLVHRVYAENARVMWKTDPYARGPRGFKLVRDKSVEFPFL